MCDVVSVATGVNVAPGSRKSHVTRCTPADAGAEPEATLVETGRHELGLPGILA